MNTRMNYLPPFAAFKLNLTVFRLAEQKMRFTANVFCISSDCVHTKEVDYVLVTGTVKHDEFVLHYDYQLTCHDHR